jgi:uncharacterized protein YndB with AHSA1/START domain
MADTPTAALVKRARVPISQETAYRLFVEDIARWWPLETHKVSDGEVTECVFEDRPGGRIYERDGEGTEHLWGTVLEAAAPDRIVFTWHPGRGPEEAQRVLLRFVPDGEETVVEIQHTGWEVLGDRAAKIRESYDTGWDYVLGKRYLSAARRAERQAG